MSQIFISTKGEEKNWNLNEIAIEEFEVDMEIIFMTKKKTHH